MYTVVIAYFLTWLLIPSILLQKKPPVATLTWLFTIVCLPFFGPLLFFLIGPDRIRRKRLKKQEKFEGEAGREKPESSHYDQQNAALLANLEINSKNLFQILAKINELPTSSIIDHQLLCDAASYYQSLLHCIENARHHVHLQVFIWQEDRYGTMLLEALTAAAQKGIKIRLMLDEIGSLNTSESFFQPLIDAGGMFAWFSSLHFRKNRFFVNLRNHRKIQIIDGKVGFVGGMNIGREYAGEDPKFGDWFDMQIKFSGSLCADLQQCFAEDWFYATEEKIEGDSYFPSQDQAPRYTAQVIASGPDSERDPMHKSFLALLNAARKRVWITTGYFVPSEILLTGLQMCALRNIEIRLLVPTVLDHPFMKAVSRSFYDELLPYGIELVETVDDIYHAKTMIVDDSLSMIGSANFDNRSMLLNFELNVVIHSAGLNQTLAGQLSEYFAKGSKVVASEYDSRTFRSKLIEAAARPFAPIL